MSKLDKYQKWLKDISDEVLGLTFSLDVWKQVIEIENNSKYFRWAFPTLEKSKLYLSYGYNFR